MTRPKSPTPAATEAPTGDGRSRGGPDAETLRYGNREHVRLPDATIPDVTPPPIPLGFRLPAAAPTELVGQVIAGQFRVVSRLAQGGFGAVYVADQLRAGSAAVLRRAVVKVIRPDRTQAPDATARFEREAKLLAQLDHHHVVKLYSFGALPDGQLFLAMEHGGDATLGDLVRREGRLEPARALRLAGQMSEALEEAHRHGVVHRDMKPGNVLVSRRGPDEWVKVVDFGIGKIVEHVSGEGLADATATLTGAGIFIGTAAYASPEQARGAPVDARSDLYSLGVLLFELLTGALPFRASTAHATLFHQVNTPAPRLGIAGLPAEVEAVVAKALAKRPEDRYQTARELRTALGDALQSLVRKRTALESPAPRSRRSSLLLGFAALAIAGLASTIVALAPGEPTTTFAIPPAEPALANAAPTRPVATATREAPTLQAPIAAATPAEARPAYPAKRVNPVAVRPRPAAETMASPAAAPVDRPTEPVPAPPPPEEPLRPAAPVHLGTLRLNASGSTLRVRDEAGRTSTPPVALLEEEGSFELLDPDRRWVVEIVWRVQGSRVRLDVSTTPASVAWVGAHAVGSNPRLLIGGDPIKISFRSPESARELELLARYEAAHAP